MGYLYLLFTVNDRIATITVNREQSLNALNNDVLDELDTAFSEVETREDIGCAILTGKGRAFVAGADILSMAKMTNTEGREAALHGQRVFYKIESLSKPVIAAVNGFALGGGCELAMCCDIRIASEKARFGLPEVGLGIIPGHGGTQRLPRLIGKGMAKYLCMTGEHLKADEAYRIGLVEKVVSPDELMDEALRIAKIILCKAPLSVGYVKKAINYAADTSLESGIGFEAEIYTSAFMTEDRVEGMNAFIEKREPHFQKK